MKEEGIRVVLDEDMEQLLINIGELDKIERGEVYCRECGAPITLKTIQVIIPLPSKGFEYVCTNRQCVESSVASQ